MPETITHPTSQALAAFTKGQLPEAAAAKVARHLENCATCRQTAAQLSPGRGSTRIASGAGLRESVASSGPSLALPPELAEHPKYRIVRELGRGGMGVVYQAVQTLMDRPVAIKVINPSVLQHADALPRFQAEVKAAAKLDHPNIVRAYDADQVGSLHLLVMEFVDGRNLADVVQKGALPIAHACHYVRQAALGLQHAFEQGMTHRDIKPHNLMLAARGVVKILDFGLARLRSSQTHESGLTASGSFMGTPDYVAPEQATDARTADTRSDLYSLGCTLYHLLTGRPPFQEDTTVKLVLAHLEKEPLPLPSLRPDVPAELAAVVSRLLAKDPAQRYQTPVEVAQALVPFIKAGATPPPAPVTPPPVPTASPGKGTITGGDTSRQATLGVKAARTAPALMEAIVCDEEIEVVQPAEAGRFKHWPIVAGVGGLALTLGLAVGVLAALGKLPFGAHHDTTPVDPVSVTRAPEPAKPARLAGTAEEEEAIRTAKDTLSQYVDPHKVKERQRGEAKQIRTWTTEMRLKLETTFNEELSRVDAEYRKRARAALGRKWVQEIREWSRLVLTKRSDCKDQASNLARAYMVDLQAAYTRYEEYVATQFAEVSSIEELARRHSGKSSWKQIADRYAQILPAADKTLQSEVQAAGQRAAQSRDEFIKILGGYLDRFAEQQAQAPQPKEDTTPSPPVNEHRTPSPSRGGRKRPRPSREHHATPTPAPKRLDAEAEARKDYNLAHELYKSSIDSNTGAVPDSILSKVRDWYQKIINDYPETKAAEDAKKELKRISNL